MKLEGPAFHAFASISTSTPAEKKNYLLIEKGTILILSSFCSFLWKTSYLLL